MLAHGICFPFSPSFDSLQTDKGKEARCHTQCTLSVSPGEHSLGTDTFPDAEPLGWQKDPVLPGGLREVVGRCGSSGRDLLAGEGARMLRAV